MLNECHHANQAAEALEPVLPGIDGKAGHYQAQYYDPNAHLRGCADDVFMNALGALSCRVQGSTICLPRDLPACGQDSRFLA